MSQKQQDKENSFVNSFYLVLTNENPLLWTQLLEEWTTLTVSVFAMTLWSFIIAQRSFFAIKQTLLDHLKRLLQINSNVVDWVF